MDDKYLGPINNLNKSSTEMPIFILQRKYPSRDARTVENI